MLGVAQSRQGPAAEVSETDSLDLTEGLVVEQGLADQVLVQSESSRDGFVLGHPHQPERVQDQQVRRGVIGHGAIVGSQTRHDRGTTFPWQRTPPRADVPIALAPPGVGTAFSLATLG